MRIILIMISFSIYYHSVSQQLIFCNICNLDDNARYYNEKPLNSFVNAKLTMTNFITKNQCAKNSHTLTIIFIVSLAFIFKILNLFVFVQLNYFIFILHIFERMTSTHLKLQYNSQSSCVFS